MGDERHSDYVSERHRFYGGNRAPSQQEQLDRVSGRIAGAILAFFTTHLDQEFRADDLRLHIASQCGLVAPASADRVMRDMRRRGVIAYRVVNRAQSLYQALRPGKSEPSVSNSPEISTVRPSSARSSRTYSRATNGTGLASSDVTLTAGFCTGKLVTHRGSQGEITFPSRTRAHREGDGAIFTLRTPMSYRW